MTEPTNKELDAVIKHCRACIYPQDMHPHFERAIMREALAKWSTPQPTQAQAGAVPLTDEQMAKLYRQSAMRDRIMVRGDWEQGVRDAEAAHDIKGEKP